MDMADLIRVKTAGDYMKVTSQYVYTLIKTNKLESVEIDGVTFVSRKQVEAFQAARESQKH